MTQTATEELDQPATLSKALTEFLIEFSIGVHRYAMYPVGHPSNEPVLGNIMERLSDLFVDRPTVSIGVAARQLIMEGTATDPKHPVLADLAKRLHDHQLGALSFERAVTSPELAQMLELVASESSRDGTPIGLREGDDFPQWQNVRMHPVGYEQLQLKDSSGTESSGHLDRASTLWLGLAQAALAAEGSLPATPDAASVVAYEHHIRIDGGGYPRVAFDRACHQASNLVHVCDVFDALRTHRPYREAWPTERALGIIEEGAGPEFDLEIATAFVTMMRKWEDQIAEVSTDDPEIQYPDGNKVRQNGAETAAQDGDPAQHDSSDGENGGDAGSPAEGAKNE